MDQTVRILIVEDNVIIADDMQSMLEEIGYEIVSSVMAFEQAVKVLAENEVDLVLIDIVLASDKTGIDLENTLERNTTSLLYLSPLIQIEQQLKVRNW